MAIPKNDDGNYKECHYYIKNYTQFTDEELINWNRSEMVSAETQEAECSRWVYDQSDYYSTFVSRVGTI